MKVASVHSVHTVIRSISATTSHLTDTTTHNILVFIHHLTDEPDKEEFDTSLNSYMISCLQTMHHRYAHLHSNLQLSHICFYLSVCCNRPEPHFKIYGTYVQHVSVDAVYKCTLQKYITFSTTHSDSMLHASASLHAICSIQIVKISEHSPLGHRRDMVI